MGLDDASGGKRLPATNDFGSISCAWFLWHRIGSEQCRNRNGNRHTWARLERHLPLPMTVNERLVLLSVVKEVARRRLCDGVPADSPGRDVELSTSPPCRLLEKGHKVNHGKALGSNERVP